MTSTLFARNVNEDRTGAGEDIEIVVSNKIKVPFKQEMTLEGGAYGDVLRKMKRKPCTCWMDLP